MAPARGFVCVAQVTSGRQHGVDLDAQLAANADLVAERVALGDAPEVPRPLDHAALVPKKHVPAVTAALEGAGFRVDGVRKGLRRATVEFSRIDAADVATADAFTREIAALLAPFEGTYDGWGGFLAEA